MKENTIGTSHSESSYSLILNSVKNIDNIIFVNENMKQDKTI